MIRPQRSSETQERLDHLRQRHRVHKGKRSESRLEQARRLLAVAAILASARSQGLTAESVTERVREQTGKQWCERTVRRDLDALHNMGIVNQTDGRKRGCGNPYVWLGHSKNLTRVVLQAAESTASDCRGTGPLKAFLSSLPDPWDMDAERHRVATHAARLVAMTESSNREFLKCELIFTLGQGWALRVLDVPVSAFDQAKPLSQLAKNQFEEAVGRAVA